MLATVCLLESANESHRFLNIMLFFLVGQRDHQALKNVAVKYYKETVPSSDLVNECMVTVITSNYES